MDPAQRALRARLAAHTLHSKYDSREIAASARKAFMDRFEAYATLGLRNLRRRPAGRSTAVQPIMAAALTSKGAGRHTTGVSPEVPTPARCGLPLHGLGLAQPGEPASSGGIRKEHS
jgi:hypothetical protein